MNDYTFAGQLAMSRGTALNATVEDILLDAIPGATGVRRASETDDRAGTDWWVDQFSGDALSIDLKARAGVYGPGTNHDDLALEVWSVVEQRVPGWTRDARKRTDYILWWWRDTGRWCLVSFPMLCRVFIERLDAWQTRYRWHDQSTDSRYHSRCIFVPRPVVWREIYLRYGGQRSAA